MVSTRQILHQVGISYEGVKLNGIKALREYGNFLCGVIDSEERHTTAITLHTGSIYHQAMAIAVAVLGCLFYHNTDTAELIETLTVGDMLIIDGQRVRFQGIKDGGQLGVGYKRGVKYFLLEYHNRTKAVQLDNAPKLNISVYQGETDKLGGQGVKSTLKPRKEFLSAFIKDKVQTEISTEINHSIAIILDRTTAEQFYRGIYFNYNNKKVALSEIVTANYYSEEESYQIGNNPTKEEPIIKFYSKISICRDAVMDDSKKRIIGCFVGDEGVWAENSEAHDIADRKGLKFIHLAGKTHYTRYLDWYDSDEYKFYASVPETVQNLLVDAEFTTNTQSLKKELCAFANRKISDEIVGYGNESNVVFEIKRKLLKIKQTGIGGDKKENFLMTSYFLLNLCRSAIFPLCYCDKACQKKFINWTITEKIECLKEYFAILIGEARDDAEFVIEKITLMVSALYNTNPKGEILKEKIVAGRAECVVVTKAYYEQLFSSWMDDCKITYRPKIVTISAFEKSKETLKNVIFSTAYYDFSFNPYANFGFVSAEVLIYEYEGYQARYLKKIAEKGRKLLHDKNVVVYDIIETPEEEIVSEFVEDEKFESEMDKMAKDLLLKGAYRYVSTSNSAGDGTVKIEKIFTFVSGCVGYFTKYYKGYRIRGEEVIEVDLDELKVGDNMVFTKQSENKDIVDLLLTQLLDEQYKHTAYPEYYRLSVCWKEILRDYMRSHYLTYQELADRLGRVGCSKHYTTIRSWLDAESHVVGPRDLNDYEALVKLVDLGEYPADIKKGCDEIRKLRMRILDLLGKAIIRGMFAEDRDPVSELVYREAENLTQIEQITSITVSGSNAVVPINLSNKPCNT